MTNKSEELLELQILKTTFNKIEIEAYYWIKRLFGNIKKGTL